jgi:hypothetical protein
MCRGDHHHPVRIGAALHDLVLLGEDMGDGDPEDSIDIYGVLHKYRGVCGNVKFSATDAYFVA